MALLYPVTEAFRSQGYGEPALAVLSREPEMWANAQRAYWQQRAGLRHYEHFHAGLDLSAALGTEIRASEAGTVTFAGWRENGGGLCMQVEIRPNVRYEHAHCSSILTPVGKKVSRGQVIARVGSTGNTTGPHTHFSVSIREVVAGLATTYLYDPELFLPGGALANDPRIRPIGPPPVQELPDTAEVVEMAILENLEIPADVGRLFDVSAGVVLRKGPGTGFPKHFTTTGPIKYVLVGFDQDDQGKRTGWVAATSTKDRTGVFYVPPVH